ncbi:hypothetical protein [Halobacillus trueperi]|uniref:hypothetical protein n=1 Tax=Halobacillus trueperi TaxID=156205 RepID=UPI0037352375
MQIDLRMIEGCYIYGQKFYLQQIDRVEATTKISRYYGMNSGSANGYIQAFYCMMNGERYTQSLNTKATEYYLKRIQEEYGIGQLLLALESVRNHIKYYESFGKGKLKSLEKVVKDFESAIGSQ